MEHGIFRCLSNKLLDICPSALVVVRVILLKITLEAELFDYVMKKILGRLGVIRVHHSLSGSKDDVTE